MEKQCEIDGYVLKKKIGQGSFGQVYEAQKGGQLYAIKAQHIATVKPMVALEFQIYRQIWKRQPFFSKGQSMPAVFEYIQKECFSYLVMQKLDITLQDFVNLHLRNELEKDVFILLMFNTLKCLEQLHQLGYVYRDVKPSNFMLKNDESEEGKSQICLIDLGLCKRFLKKGSQEHIALRGNKKMIGTPIFCSINMHRGLELSRRDDLEAWLYMSSYLVNKLPWEELAPRGKSGLQNKEQKEELYKEIGKKKEDTNFHSFLKEQKKLPNCITKIYEYIKDLQFQARPNYDFIYNLLEQQYKKLTGVKCRLKDVYFSAKSYMINEKSVKPIKIKFKVPEKKKEKVATESIDALDFKIDK